MLGVTYDRPTMQHLLQIRSFKKIGSKFVNFRSVDLLCTRKRVQTLTGIADSAFIQLIRAPSSQGQISPVMAWVITLNRDKKKINDTNIYI